MVKSSTTPAPDHTTFEHQMVWYGGNRTHLRIAAPPAHPTVIPTNIEVTNSATRYHPIPVPTPNTKPIDDAQANSQTDHEQVEPELATPTKDSPPHASPKMIRLTTKAAGY